MKVAYLLGHDGREGLGRCCTLTWSILAVVALSNEHQALPEELRRGAKKVRPLWIDRKQAGAHLDLVNLGLGDPGGSLLQPCGYCCRVWHVRLPFRCFSLACRAKGTLESWLLRSEFGPCEDHDMFHMFMQMQRGAP